MKKNFRLSLARMETTAIFLSILAAGSAVLAAPPKVTTIFPAGAQRGQTTTITAAGDFPTWPAQVWSDRPGLTFTSEKDKGKFKVDVAPDSGAGVYWLRMHNGDGASPPRPFIVGTLAEVAEAEPNDAPDKPQLLKPRVVVNGKLGKSGDVDGYRVELQAGQTLVASLQANSTLGAPMDAVLQLCELVERPAASIAAANVEAFVVIQNHDAVGLDPQIVFTPQKTGPYLVRLFAYPATPDSSIRFAGGDDYIYRLTLTTGTVIDYALPLASAFQETQVTLGGWNLTASAASIIPPITAESDPLLPPDNSLTWIWRPDAAGALTVPRVEHPLAVGPQEITPPAVITGRLAAPGQTDRYPFAAKKDEKLRFRVAAKSLGFPTDAVLAVNDESGKTLAEIDDAGRDDRDPQLDFSPPADGRYTLFVRDLAGRGDNRLIYRLTIEKIRPDFQLALAADSFVLDKGKPLEITINVTVRDALREPIEFRAVGLPEGVTAEPMKFEPSGDSPMPDTGGRRGRGRGNAPAASGPSVKLILKGSAAAKPGGAPIRIEGRTMADAPLVRTARFPLNLPLAGSHHAAWLTVK